MNRPFPDALLSGLGALLDIDGLCADRDGCCQLLIDDEWRVTLVFQPRPQRIVLYCPLADAGATQALAAAALSAMLEASFMGRGAGGATFAIGPDRRACLQWELSVQESDERSLLAAVQALVSTAASWRERLRLSVLQAGAASAAPMDPIAEGSHPPNVPLASAFRRSLA
ncbi:type III secretion system chaperone [Ramlibacter sp. AN1015]|uniref:type III secretion system chaperone n=1 Tax=Ramlibacter sp. AN1015 TaxID=3133428 RepID=UPI0030BDC7E2